MKPGILIAGTIGLVAGTLLGLTLGRMASAPAGKETQARTARPERDRSKEQDELRSQLAALEDELARTKRELARERLAAEHRNRPLEGQLSEADTASASIAGERLTMEKRASKEDSAKGAGERREEPLTRAELEALLASDDEKTQWEGIKALRTLEDTEEAARLAAELLRTGPPKIQYGALELLADLQGSDAAVPIATLLEDASTPWWLQYRAINELGSLQNAEAIAPLHRFWEQREDRELRVQAAVALRQLGDSRAASRMIDDAQRALASEDGWQRRGAIDTLTSFGDPAHNPTFVRSLSDANSEIRRGAALALARQGTHYDLPALQDLLDDPIRPVAAAARLAIRLIEDPEARAQWIRETDK